MRFCSGYSVMPHLTYHITNARNCQPRRCWNEWKAFSLQLLPGTPKHPIFGDDFTCHTLLHSSCFWNLKMGQPTFEEQKHQHHHSTQGWRAVTKTKTMAGGVVVGGPRTIFVFRYTYFNNCKTCGFSCGNLNCINIFRYVYIIHIYTFIFIFHY